MIWVGVSHGSAAEIAFVYLDVVLTWNDESHSPVWPPPRYFRYPSFSNVTSLLFINLLHRRYSVISYLHFSVSTSPLPSPQPGSVSSLALTRFTSRPPYCSNRVFKNSVLLRRHIQFCPIIFRFSILTFVEKFTFLEMSVRSSNRFKWLFFVTQKFTADRALQIELEEHYEIEY